MSFEYFPYADSVAYAQGFLDSWHHLVFQSSIGVQITCNIILVAYHGQAWLPTCLSTLQHATAADTLLTIVANAGEHDFSQLPSSPFRCEIKQTPRSMGFAEANNFALARMNESPFAVCLLNQDTISQLGWIDACIKVLERNPKLGAATPVLLTYDGASLDPGFLEILPATYRSEDGLREMRRQELLLTNAVTAAAMVVRTDVLRKVGPFDPIYGSYYEDYDLCARIRRAGYDLGVCTTAEVRHFSGSATQTEAQRVRRSRQIIRNRAIYDIRFGGGRRAGRVAECLFRNLPRRLVRSLLRTPSSQPVGAVLGAAGDLLGLLPRLVSSSRDERQWNGYLRSIDWQS